MSILDHSFARGPLFPPKYHRPRLRYIEATDGAEAGAESSGDEGQQEQQERTFTQADVDRLIRDRLQQQAKNKFGDYDDLKSKAEGAKTVEQKLADLETKYAAAEAKALRSDIAARHGISAEDRDLFLTGTDEATLTAQATRLAQRETDRKKQGNTARNEGKSSTPAAGDERQAVRDLFGGGE